MKGAVQRVERDRKNTRYLAWHILRPHAGKGFPALEAFVEGPAKSEPTRVQTGDELYHVMRRWEAASRARADHGVKPPRPRERPSSKPKEPR